MSEFTIERTIDGLMTEFYSGEVRFERLDTLCVISIGEFVKKTEQNDEYEFPVYNGGVSPTGYYTNWNSEANSIVISARGSIGFVNYVRTRLWSGNSCYTLKKIINDIDDRFLYYYLKHNEARLYELRSVGTIPAINSKPLGGFKIPVPPLEIQRKIVRILDSFTGIEAELEAELRMRKKQYAYYCDALLDIDSSKVVYKALSDVTVSTHTINWKETNDTRLYIDLSSVDRQTHRVLGAATIDSTSAPSRAQRIVRTGDVIVATTRPTLQRYALIAAEYDNQVVSTGYCVLRASDEVLPQWLYFTTASTRFNEYCETHQEGSAYPSIADSKVKAFTLPVPSLEEQARIVSMLEKFDALTTDSPGGIPTELAARRKQYEYYRNQLLTFKERHA